MGFYILKPGLQPLGQFFTEDEKDQLIKDGYGEQNGKRFVVDRFPQTPLPDADPDHNCFVLCGKCKKPIFVLLKACPCCVLKG